jgi:signal transduction histidine kinase
MVLAVSLVDLLVPWDAAIWLGYLLILLVASRLIEPRQVFLLVALCTVMIVVGLFVPHVSDLPSPSDAFNRTVGIGLLWLIAILRVRGQRAERMLVQRSAELAHMNAELQSLSRRLMEIQEKERRALAQDLHDEAGQALTALKLELGLLTQTAGCPPDIVAQVGTMKQQVDGVMDGLHRLAMNLRPPSLDQLGLVPALYQYLETLERDGSLAVEMEVVDLNDRLPPQIEIGLYRIVQESLTNVARHAQAAHASVILQRRADAVLAIIEDDGIGMDFARARQNGHLGILGMQERIEMLGGHLHIDSEPGKGTTLFAEIPCEQFMPS